jgi:PmbA protein
MSRPAESEEELLSLARHVEAEARALGADQVTAGVSRAVHTSQVRRDGRIEQATESTTRGLGVSLLVQGRSSSHSTSDLRPDALRAFLARAVAATRHLEADPDRALPDAALCGRGSSAEALDQDDPAWYSRTAEQRTRQGEELEQAILDLGVDNRISCSVHVSDGSSVSARVTSNGFADTQREAWFTLGGDLTVSDGERRPEASAFYGARYLADLPDVATVAGQVVERARERVGASAIPSGAYPMVLVNRAAGRLLGMLSEPLSGSAIHQGRSCLADKLGAAIASERLTLLDDPTIPRGLGSRPWDGDGLIARPLAVVTKGRLDAFYVNVYYGRKLGTSPTTGGRSNWVVTPGTRSWQDITRAWPRAILVDGFLGGNSNSVTGDFSFGVRGTLLENGEKARALSEMNVSGNLLQIFEKLAELADDPYRWSSIVSPSLVFEDVQFSGS